MRRAASISLLKHADTFNEKTKFSPFLTFRLLRCMTLPTIKIIRQI